MSNAAQVNRDYDAYRCGEIFAHAYADRSGSLVVDIAIPHGMHKHDLRNLQAVCGELLGRSETDDPPIFQAIG
jgi:hypothetical protein